MSLDSEELWYPGKGGKEWVEKFPNARRVHMLPVMLDMPAYDLRQYPSIVDDITRPQQLPNDQVENSDISRDSKPDGPRT